MPEQAEQNPSRWTPELILQAVKEVVTAALGLIIVIFTLGMAYRVFTYVGENEKISDSKDVLMLVLGLAGVVIGYYFGRMPAMRGQRRLMARRRDNLKQVRDKLRQMSTIHRGS